MTREDGTQQGVCLSELCYNCVDSTTKAKVCTVDNCDMCNVSNPALCLQCAPGYIIDTDGFATDSYANACSLIATNGEITLDYYVRAYDRGVNLSETTLDAMK